MPILGDIDDYGVTIPPEWNEAEDRNKASILLLFLCLLSRINEYERLYTNVSEKKPVLLSVKDFIRRTTEDISEQYFGSRNIVNDNIIQNITEVYDFRDIPSYLVTNGVDFYLENPGIRHFLFKWWNNGFCLFFPRGRLLKKNYFQFEYISILIESNKLKIDHFQRLQSLHINPPGRSSGDISYITLEEFESFDPVIQKTITYYFYRAISETFYMEYLRNRTLLEFFKIWGDKANRIADEKLEGTRFPEVSQILRRIGITFSTPLVPSVLFNRAVFESLSNVLIIRFNEEAINNTRYIDRDSSHLPPLSDDFINAMQFNLKPRAQFLPRELPNSLFRIDLSFYNNLIMDSMYDSGSITLDETSESVWDSQTLTLDNDDTSSPSR